MRLKDPFPEAEWEIWYQDTFDRECPRSIDVSGTGLVEGLVQLWARHLFSTVHSSGFRGFSRFNLFWKQEKKSIQLEGEWEGLVLLREWVFGEKETIRGHYLEEGDSSLLALLAWSHCQLLAKGRGGELIPRLAASSRDRRDFESRLRDQ